MDTACSARVSLGERRGRTRSRAERCLPTLSTRMRLPLRWPSPMLRRVTAAVAVVGRSVPHHVGHVPHFERLSRDSLYSCIFLNLTCCIKRERDWDLFLIRIYICSRRQMAEEEETKKGKKGKRCSYLTKYFGSILLVRFLIIYIRCIENVIQ